MVVVVAVASDGVICWGDWDDLYCLDWILSKFNYVSCLFFKFSLLFIGLQFWGRALLRSYSFEIKLF